MAVETQPLDTGFLARVTCPHCWHKFAPEDALSVSQHPDLRGDSRLGGDHQRRFLATRFNVASAALDERGMPCYELACPHCHLVVPQALFELEPHFFSILGAPACGKSYLLAAMAWQLRRAFAAQFCLTFNDVDPSFNRQLNEYEETLFLSPDQSRHVTLRKTEEQGDLYSEVRFGETVVRYPAPFVFSLRPMDSHPNAGQAKRLSKALCLYDNAGESFLPGSDRASSPVTRHLAQSRALFFCYDPTQDMRFRKACQGRSADPQMQDRSSRLQREHAVRQDTILLEAAQRVRRFAGVGQQEKHQRPLVVVATKFDAWASLLGLSKLETPWVANPAGPPHALNVDLIERRSQEVRKLFFELAPELVAAAEGFASQVIYIPLSAMGRSPEVDPTTGALGIRPSDVQPQWAEAPLLYVVAKWMQGVVPIYTTRPSPRNGSL